MKAPALLLCAAAVLAAGCGPSDDGFRFHGEYGASRSGYRVQTLSEGFVEPGSDVAETAVAVVQICPVGHSGIRPVRMTLTSTPGRSIRMECSETGVLDVEWNGKTSEGLLRGLLSTLGYRNLDPEELLGSVKVIENSLAGPKGVVLEGQIASLRVIKTEIETDYPVGKTDPLKEWIAPSDLPSCDN
jgi:hypothetical protein